MKDTAKRHLKAVFEAGVAAVDPEAAVHRHVLRKGDELRVGGAVIDLSRTERVLVVGAGKASAFMARALENILGDCIAGGWINVKYGHACGLQKVRVHESGHPLPDAAGVAGSREISRLLQQASAKDLVLCCISGGGSALLPLPVAAIGLVEKQQITAALLACGAPIQELNAVRKHLSQIKGGQLARMAHPARVVALILSDVIGDPLDTIGSGPTAPDETTFADALSIISKYELDGAMPTAALEHLRAGTAGALPDTPKPGAAAFDNVTNIVVANNQAAVAACATKAEQLGYQPHIITTTIQGEARQVAVRQVATARGVLERGVPVALPACIISGGETTVILSGDGLGGRNQEFALAGAVAMAGVEGLALLAAGTDGTDGPTDAAGAFADGDALFRAAALGLDAADFLRRNDSYHFFDALDDLLKSGPTGTNVMDLYLFLVGIAPTQ